MQFFTCFVYNVIYVAVPLDTFFFLVAHVFWALQIWPFLYIAVKNQIANCHTSFL